MAWLLIFGAIVGFDSGIFLFVHMLAHALGASWPSLGPDGVFPYETGVMIALDCVIFMICFGVLLHDGRCIQCAEWKAAMATAKVCSLQNLALLTIMLAGWIMCDAPGLFEEGLFDGALKFLQVVSVALMACFGFTLPEILFT